MLNNGPETVISRCPITPCKLIVSAEIFKALLSPASYNKYLQYYRKSFVTENKCTRYCPAPDCNYAVISQSMKQADIICKCGFDFCYKKQCKYRAHRPISCDILIEWYSKIGTDESDLWMKLNTKSCPKCKVSIQKNDGCNHMTCMCKYEFCWLCMGDFRNH